MTAILVLLTAAIVFGLGFVATFMWWVSLSLFAVWLAGFVIRRRGARWYVW